MQKIDIISDHTCQCVRACARIMYYNRMFEVCARTCIIIECLKSKKVTFDDKEVARVIKRLRG